MTTGHADKIRACVEICIRRTEAAIHALADGKTRSFLKRMRERSMALHNLRAIDAIAQSIGYDIVNDPEIYSLATRLQQLDQSLMSSMGRHQSDIQSQLQKLESGKRRIARYKSRSGDRKNLVQTV